MSSTQEEQKPVVAEATAKPVEGAEVKKNSSNSKRAEKKKEKEAAKKEAAAAGASAPSKQGEKKEKEAKGKDADKELRGPGVAKSDDPSEWYVNTLLRSEMFHYHDISGCYILRPMSFSIWEKIQSFFDGEIKKLEVQNAYFPLFVSQRALEKEKDHIEGFAPEVAWVTRAGQSEMAEPVAVRPTSETIMYPAYSEWIRSHRDLPLKLNQWSNVVRWEFKHPVPFMRCREFLWQEGHTAFATKAESDEEVLQILELYKQVYEDLLAVPVIKGTKTEKEKFAGGLYTTTLEAFIPVNGRAIQAATSHSLGQNFAKMFNIKFEDDKGEQQYVWQNSWGLTIRTIGVMTLVHGDDKGLVLPPRIAPVQVAIVPIYFANKDNSATDVRCKALLAELKAVGVRTQFDDRSKYTPKQKFEHWELKGVPIRIEVGPKDIEAKQVVFSRRDTDKKETVKDENITAQVQAIIVEMQKSLLEKARAERDAHIVKVTEWKDFVPALDNKNITLCSWCDRIECEDAIKKRSGEESHKANVEAEKGFKLTGSAKSLCIPHQQDPMPAGTKCFTGCGHDAVKWTLFGRSY